MKRKLLIVWIVWGWVVSLRAQVSVSIPNMNVQRGATADVPFQVSGILPSDSLIAYQLAVVYNPAVVQGVGASKSGTMTQNWDNPTVAIKSGKTQPPVDTLRVVGITTNQPGKRVVQDEGILVKLNFLVTGNVGDTVSVRIQEIRLFHKSGEFSIGTKTKGVLTVVENPNVTTVNLTLYPGINFISFPLTPNPNKLPDVLGGVPVNYVWGYFSGRPKSWQEGRPGNPLEAVDGLHGYWMRLNDTVSRTLTLTGPHVAITTPLQMIRGLNLISYLPDEPDNLQHAFASLDTNYAYVWTYNAATGKPQSWLRGRPGNPLSTLTPLLAYWVRMSNPGTLVYPSSGYSVPKAFVFLPRFTLAGDSNHIISTTEWCDFWAYQPETLHPGDTIRAYDPDGILCGDTVIAEYGGFVMPVAGDDPMTPEDEGMLPGEEVRFTINGKPVQVLGASANMDTNIIPGGKPIWTPLGSIRVELDVVTGEVKEKESLLPFPNRITLFQNYPNPFNSQTRILYSLDISTDVRMEIFDIQGKRIRLWNLGHQTQGTHSMLWDGRDEENCFVPSGLYYLVLRAGHAIRITKCVFLK